MPSTYRTPGVYVEEITKFPPSVAAVETAIPAFIGYTERATEKATGDLIGVAKKITAIAEYDRYYGGPDTETGFVAQLVDTVDPNTGRIVRQVSVPRPSSLSPFRMAYALQMYFANGGGPCYIISVGTYTQDDNSATTISIDDLGNTTAGDGGLDILEKEDEPTLIVFPDSQALNDGDFYSLYQAALAQCNKLQDRFAIMDTKSDSATAPSLFRNGIGTTALKYGGVYYPFLETTLDYRYADADVEVEHTRNPVFNLPNTSVDTLDAELLNIATETTAADVIGGRITTSVEAVTVTAGTAPDKRTAIGNLGDNDLTPLIGHLEAVQSSVTTVLAAANATFDALGDADVETAIDNIDTAILAGHISTLQQLSDNIATGSEMPGGFSSAESDAAANQYSTEAQAAITTISNLEDTLLPALRVALEANDPTVIINAVDGAMEDARQARQLIDGIGSTPADVAAASGTIVTQLGALGTAVGGISSNVQEVRDIQLLDLGFMDLNAYLGQITDQQAIFAGPPADAAAFTEAYDQLQLMLTDLFVALNSTQNTITYLDLNALADTNGNVFLSQIEQVDNDSYNAIKQEIATVGVILPPSSSMAGIYAAVDRDRGVWKAPANVSLSSVVKPTVKINNAIQDGLNVDVVAGKSVNAIRAFSGKGTMVWGARTLAGNDNEWRYISVRRFFNMVEESVKKATDQFVFEPNDANTWVRVRAMIENFLILQWRAGALAGAQPDDAFFVRVGLGETMTSQDILEGRMIVEIGMAVVRPAEFIILRFSHKMQES